MSKIKGKISQVIGVHIEDDKTISSALRNYDKAGLLDLKTLQRVIFEIADYLDDMENLIK